MSIIKEGNQLIVQLGTGDVIISAAAPKFGALNTELVFSNSTIEHGIGDECNESVGIKTDKLDGPVIRLQFNKLASLQVVEDMLIAVKKDMQVSESKKSEE